MELELLKTRWISLGNASSPFDEKEITEILAKKSQTSVANMKRNLMIEATFMFILYIPVCIFYFTGFNQKLPEIAWFIIIVMFVFGIYYFKKNRLLKEMQLYSNDVKSSLTKGLKALEKYLAFYRIMGMILVPACILLLCFIFYFKLPADPGSVFYPTRKNPFWKVTLLWLFTAGIICFIFYLLNSWYVKKQYIQHMNHLKTLLKEMDPDH